MCQSEHTYVAHRTAEHLKFSLCAHYKLSKATFCVIKDLWETDKNGERSCRKVNVNLNSNRTYEANVANLHRQSYGKRNSNYKSEAHKRNLRIYRVEASDAMKDACCENIDRAREDLAEKIL